MGLPQTSNLSVRQLARTAKGFIRRGLADGALQLGAGIPQAETNDTSLQTIAIRDWRTYFADRLNGRGLEIGPLHRPMVRHDGMQVEYIDRCTVAELRLHYPELSELPLVEPDILGDAETLSSVRDDEYDFLISAHVIEHMKNPLGSLQHWCRVLRTGGLLYLIVPDKRVTFDKRRVRTTLGHLIKDFRHPSTERDYEHYLDYAIHVHDQDGSAALAEADRLIETDYSIHFHVFLPSDLVRLLGWFSTNVRPLTIIEGPVMSPGSDEFHFLLRV